MVLFASCFSCSTPPWLAGAAGEASSMLASNLVTSAAVPWIVSALCICESRIVMVCCFWLVNFTTTFSFISLLSWRYLSVGRPPLTTVVVFMLQNLHAYCAALCAYIQRKPMIACMMLYVGAIGAPCSKQCCRSTLHSILEPSLISMQSMIMTTLNRTICNQPQSSTKSYNAMC